MAERFERMLAEHQAFIEQQHMYFVGTAAPDGYVNVSPKGRDTLRVLNENQVAWLNLTGSGNETAAHLLEANRMTVMFCSFDRQPLILRLYGKVRCIQATDPDWYEWLAQFGNPAGARQVFVLDIALVQTSCGFAVPFYTFDGERDTLDKWAMKKGEDGIREYWQVKNTRSLDDKETGVPTI
ncbi:pyridoxamine 5'-phosphate oxidase [Pseudohongiella nitratireducens]|uniref:Pyridoxamine 5'-phosphate oxidase n=1 Tax=Pseudohongiella nitratireducens TaxID=1768907 RepID=A0A917GLS5_9GAMM|nr:pyridoxamine 5'-phosphate oxidase family protein [Pseudohongiella nitratireducens]MDF1622126.1 pyridoxamine 5'-phosphate oxidase family protein [Pseudohongiella nitratireducens]GGG51237.1 pyridoxamine 5'-phosphate oxidase [Pseudohongiella nitratireducens]